MSDTNINIAAGTTPVFSPPEQKRASVTSNETSPTMETEHVLEVTSETSSISKQEALNAELREAIESLGDAAGIIDRNFNLKVDEETDRLIIQVIDRETQEVIRQFPEEEVLNITKRLREYIGLVFDVEV